MHSLYCTAIMYSTMHHTTLHYNLYYLEYGHDSSLANIWGNISECLAHGLLHVL